LLFNTVILRVSEILRKPFFRPLDLIGYSELNYTVFSLVNQLALYMDVRSNEAAPWTARLRGSVSYHSLHGKT